MVLVQSVSHLFVWSRRRMSVCLSGRTDENKWITQNTAEDNNKSLQSVWGYTRRVSKRLVVANWKEQVRCKDRHKTRFILILCRPRKCETPAACLISVRPASDTLCRCSLLSRAGKVANKHSRWRNEKLFTWHIFHGCKYSRWNAPQLFTFYECV